MYVSQETPEITENRLLCVISEAVFKVYEERYVFYETACTSEPVELQSGALAMVRDEEVVSQLVPVSLADRGEPFKIVRFHFKDGVDNSGFVGWLATLLKQKLGTGVFVLCGQNSRRGGIFDYWGFPAEVGELAIKEIENLRKRGTPDGKHLF